MRSSYFHLLLPFVVTCSTGSPIARQASSGANGDGTSRPTLTSSNSASPSSPTGTSIANTTSNVNATSSGPPSSEMQVRLARMPYKQILCSNISHVMTGTTLNVSWTSKGNYSNTLYVKYATDNYTAWNSAMPTQPGTAGNKLGKAGESDSKSDYLMTYQVCDSPCAACEAFELNFSIHSIRYLKAIKAWYSLLCSWITQITKLSQVQTHTPLL